MHLLPIRQGHVLMVEVFRVHNPKIPPRCPRCGAMWMLDSGDHRDLPTCWNAQCAHRTWTYEELAFATSEQHQNGHASADAGNGKSFVRPIGETVPNESQTRFKTARELALEEP